MPGCTWLGHSYPGHNGPVTMCNARLPVSWVMQSLWNNIHLYTSLFVKRSMVDSRNYYICNLNPCFHEGSSIWLGKTPYLSWVVSIMPYYYCTCACTNSHPSRRPEIIFQGTEMLAANQRAASSSACGHHAVRVIIGGKGVEMTDHPSCSSWQWRVATFRPTSWREPWLASYWVRGHGFAWCLLSWKKLQMYHVLAQPIIPQT